MPRAAVAAIVCLLTAACSAQHESPCPQLGEVLAFREELRRASCALQTRCYNDGTAGWISRGDGAACTSPGPMADRVCADLASGAITFHPERVADCLAALAAQAGEPCLVRPAFGDAPRWDFGDPEACREVLTHPPPPPVTGAGDCITAGCPRESICLVGDGCGGHCVAASREGEPCGIIGCATGFYCDYATETCRAGCFISLDCDDGSYCIDHACVATTLPAVGEPCLHAERPYCDGMLAYCNARTDMCTTLALPGETCDPEGGRSACFGGACDPATATCRSDPLYCFPSSSGYPGSCVLDTPYCGVEQHCTAEPSLAACDILGPDGGFEQCPPGLTCDLRHLDLAAPLQPCRPRALRGEACDDSVICEDGTTCWAGVCVRIVGLDEACGVDHPCPLPLVCREGTCVYITTQGVGDPCDADHACFQGVCREGHCAWLDPGAPCSSSMQCREGYYFGCMSGVCADSVVVGDGERCNFSDRFCADGLFCYPTGAQDRLGWVDICRAPCAAP